MILTRHISVMKSLLLSTLSLLAIGLLAACGGYDPGTTQIQNPSASASQISSSSAALGVDQMYAQGGNHTFSFPVVPAAAAIQKCLPHARGQVTILPDKFNDTMKFQVYSLAPKQEYTLFVTQYPNKPFGISWYQGKIATDSHGDGSVIVRGIFDPKTFSVSPGGTTTFDPTHQYHLGLWFSDPETPFKLGCEPGAKEAIVTPFNGKQHAGILALNTSNFPVNAGPLSKVPTSTLDVTQKQSQVSLKGSHAFSFPAVPASAAVQNCLPHARSEVTILPDEDGFNETMNFKVYNLAPKQEYTLFVTQYPNKPFGISWYQGKIATDGYGNGNVIVRGIFDAKTFSVSPGGTVTFAPTHQYHLGLWFSDPETPFKLGCEPGAKAPIVTPFNGKQHAGILALNTKNFPDNAGPLSKV